MCVFVCVCVCECGRSPLARTVEKERSAALCVFEGATGWARHTLHLRTSKSQTLHAGANRLSTQAVCRPNVIAFFWSAGLGGDRSQATSSDCQAERSTLDLSLSEGGLPKRVPIGMSVDSVGYPSERCWTARSRPLKPDGRV